MIEKLPFAQIHSGGEDMVDRVKLQPVDAYEMQHKINELVDVVNELQKDREEIKEWIGIVSDLRSRVPVKESRVSILEEHAHPTARTEPADPYAEQRKWIGKVCVFWDNDDTQQLSYGVLTKIDTESGFGVQYCCNDEYDYDDCEPVKPNDDIIFKGE